MYLPFYSSSLSIRTTPASEISSDYQQVVKNSLDSASTFKVVGETQQAGYLVYSDIECRITSLIDPKTGKTFGDQYRKIIFDDVNHEKWLGQMYKIGDEVWLATNTSTRIGASAYSVLRKCNNFLRWVDSQNRVISYPCVFSRDISSENMSYGGAGTPQIWGKSLIQVQRNNDTNKLKFNDRLIFDGIAFQIEQVNNHVSDTYLELYVFEVQVQSNDDVVNNVANGNNATPISGSEIRILPAVNSIIKGSTQPFTIYKYVNGVAQPDTFNIVASQALSANYTLRVSDGNNFSVECVNVDSTLLKITCTDVVSLDSIDLFVKLTGNW